MCFRKKKNNINNNITGRVIFMIYIKENYLLFTTSIIFYIIIIYGKSVFTCYPNTCTSNIFESLINHLMSSWWSWGLSGTLHEWRHNVRDGVSNHQPHECLLNSFIQGADQRKYQRFASLAFVRGIHPWPVISPHKGPITRKMFPYDDIIMTGISVLKAVILCPLCSNAPGRA